MKLWLFIAYVVSFVSLAASVGLLIQDALVKSGPSAWTGVAGVLQCVFILIRLRGYRKGNKLLAKELISLLEHFDLYISYRYAGTANQSELITRKILSIKPKRQPSILCHYRYCLHVCLRLAEFTRF
ncbi:hypothetical protein CDL12_22261 [Handroanthus impetiginosus]|uniref:Uncharacterized protein n=1 Tax=Handroanthus impetiginosus TaxID=429701 RepID=A0A2G9GJJ1_9LAMI|nr:hypothetical protein CDL12_22261 [Handroanthus impetiginosus]